MKHAVSTVLFLAFLCGDAHMYSMNGGVQFGQGNTGFPRALQPTALQPGTAPQPQGVTGNARAIGGGNEANLLSEMMKEIHMLSVLAPPGPIGMELEDGSNGPVVKLVDPASPVYGSVCPGDIVVSIDDVLTTQMLSVHLAGILMGKLNEAKTLVIFPASTQECSRTFARVVTPGSLQLKRPPAMNMHAAQDQAVAGQVMAQTYQEEQPMPPDQAPRFIKAAEEAHLPDGRKIACVDSPKFAMLAAGIDKVPRLSLPAFKDTVASFANSSAFCRLLDFEPFAAPFKRMFECDILFKDGMDCGQLQMLIGLEARNQRLPGLLPDAPRKSFWISPFALCAFVALLLWIVIIVCLYADCVEMLLTASDRRVKRDVICEGNSMLGIPTYTFRYADDASGARYRGTMAQDLLQMGKQDAVHADRTGTLRVDYSKLDVEACRVDRVESSINQPTCTLAASMNRDG